MEEEIIKEKPKMEKRTKEIIFLIIGIVLTIALFVIYNSIINPSIINYQNQLREEGINLTVQVIITTVYEKGYFDIFVGNKTLRLVPYSLT